MTALGKVGNVVISEHYRIVDDEYRFAGEVKHRQRHVTSYAACCVDCGANTTASLLVQVRNWSKRHTCEAVAR